MLTYSIAIRTLGTAGCAYRETLESIARQSVQPDRVLVFIADGYSQPDFTVGREEYVRVPKGMVSQRIRPYGEIASDLLLLLDDDVQLAPDSAERMLKTLERYGADCVAADTFRNHDMPATAKLYAALTNLVFPHGDGAWAFKIRRNGSFSYNNRPTRNFYWSQSCAGNAMMWRMAAYRQLHLEDEMWLDELPFAYGDDMVESYKLYRNGFRLGVLYDAGCVHLDGGSSSRSFRAGPQWICTRTTALFIAWWRTIFQPSRPASVDRWLTVCSFWIKAGWLFLVICGVALFKWSPRYIDSYVKGLIAGWRFVHTAKFKSLRGYVLR